MSKQPSSTPATDTKPVGLQDIAAALGVSIGTVDRALHNRPGVNPMTQSKVVQMARTLGYRPNRAASFLASRRRLRIGAVLPRIPDLFFGAVREGIFEAARAFESAGVSVEYRPCPWLKEGEVEAVERALDDGVNGLIVAPGTPDSLKALIRKASRINVPVVCVATDAPGTERLTSVAADPAASGSIAAELLGGFLQGKGRVAVVTGSLLTATHAETLAGFRATLGRFFPDMELCAAIEAHDDEEEAHSKSLGMLANIPGIAGIYVGTSTSMPVLRALDEAGLTGRVKVIAMDLFPALADRIRAGDVAASIYQRPRNQGRLALQALCLFVTEGVCPPSQIRFPSHLVMRSNLDLFLKTLPEREPSEDLAAGSAAATTAVVG